MELTSPAREIAGRFLGAPFRTRPSFDQELFAPLSWLGLLFGCDGHIVGASPRALRPTCFRFDIAVSPRVAALRIFEATCVRAVVSRRQTFWQTSSRTAGSGAVVSASKIGDLPQRCSHDA